MGSEFLEGEQNMGRYQPQCYSRPHVGTLSDRHSLGRIPPGYHRNIYIILTGMLYKLFNGKNVIVKGLTPISHLYLKLGENPA